MIPYPALQRSIEAAAAAVAGHPVPVSGLRVPHHPEQSDVYSTVAWEVAVATGQDTMQVAADVARRVAEQHLDGVRDVRACPPGFVNVFLEATAYSAIVAALLDEAPPGDLDVAEWRWALERRASAYAMAERRHLLPLHWQPEDVGRLTLAVERELLARLGLVYVVPVGKPRQRYVDTLLRLFHHFYAHVPVLAMDPQVARARLGLMEACLRAVALALSPVRR
jgi:arginyl-tRNA synthetase